MDILNRGKKQVIISGVCALLTQVIVFMGEWFGFNYIGVFVFSFLVVVVVGYGLLCFLHETRVTATGFTKYFIGMSMNFPVSLFVMYVCVDLLGLHPLYGSTSGMVILFLYNYQVGKWSIR